MELGKQLVHYRKKMNLSQEELAEKIYVTRQSISNWENDKTYPDIHSLLLLSHIFQVTLDTLVEGDLETMKMIVQKKDLEQVDKDTKWMLWGMVLTSISAYPLFYYLGWWGVPVFLLEWTITMRFALRIEKFKKTYDVQTYRQIVAITNGETLDTIQRAEERGKYPYQKVLLVLVFTLASGLLAWLTSVVLHLLF